MLAGIRQIGSQGMVPRLQKLKDSMGDKNRLWKIQKARQKRLDDLGHMSGMREVMFTEVSSD